MATKRDVAPRRGAKRLATVTTGQSPNRNYAALAEEQFGANGFAGKSLLRSLAGAIRIPAPRNSLLARIVKERQSTYASILGRVMSGASLVSSAVAVGIGRETIRGWLVQGLKDQSENLDTYYSRFASDIHAALAHSVGEAELAVMRRNPIEYLRSGPGRAFYQERENYWQPVDPRMPPPVSDIEPLAEMTSEQTDTLPSDRASLALDALKELGILDNPEYAKQLREQSNQHHQELLVDGQPVVVERTGSVHLSSIQTDSTAPSNRNGMDRSMHTDEST